MAITGVMKVTPTAEVGICSLMCIGDLNLLSLVTPKKSQDMEQETMLQVGSDRMIARYVCYEPFTVRLAHKCEWQREFNPDIKRGLVWYIQTGAKQRHWCSGV
jgi:hypothetical protein